MPRTSLLWLAAAAGPIIWMLSFGANYSVAGFVCQLHSKAALYGIALVAFAISAGSALLGWSQWQKLGREAPGEAAGVVGTSRILAVSGVLLGALSSLLILTQIIIPGMLGGCE